ncbi:hypothetical protein [Mobilicoccus pelagius]|uniref:Methyltransferase domain-containing protein n=1 Tax=Mobilicoccus pelagius NBRC 104925 TaxID=1089455 RepID=H5UNY9_9MICO|nr:hypothetical protein [Mobilicoccus pelagius]GAB47447.1 hypothetical protein MOPEL_011_00290 [Mobilicoccus pelagius NBRC 104925]
MTPETPRPTPAAPTAPTPSRPVEADWLALRRPADAAAREGTQRLLGRLWRHLRAHDETGGHGPVHVVDVGAGTGANQEWLAPRLPFPSRWTLLDHDAALLDHPTATGHAQRVHGGLDDLPRLVTGEGEEDAAGPTVVVASALLDLLTGPELDTLTDLLLDTGTPALFALTVDGEVTCVPHDPDDDLVHDAFEVHQQRDGIVGSAASAHVADRAREGDAEVVEATTPWRLTSADAPLLRRYLTDRAAVVAEHDPALAPRAQAWLERRLAQLDAGTLAVVVGHVDLLVLPR